MERRGHWALRAKQIEQVMALFYCRPEGIGSAPASSWRRRRRRRRRGRRRRRRSLTGRTTMQGASTVVPSGTALFLPFTGCCSARGHAVVNPGMRNVEDASDPCRRNGISDLSIPKPGSLPICDNLKTGSRRRFTFSHFSWNWNFFYHLPSLPPIFPLLFLSYTYGVWLQVMRLLDVLRPAL